MKQYVIGVDFGTLSTYFATHNAVMKRLKEQ